VIWEKAFDESVFFPAVFTGHVFPLKYFQTLNTAYGTSQIGSVNKTKPAITISHAYSMNHKTVSMKVSVMWFPLLSSSPTLLAYSRSSLLHMQVVRLHLGQWHRVRLAVLLSTV
jgi:hypothetical protein